MSNLTIRLTDEHVHRVIKSIEKDLNQIFQSFIGKINSPSIADSIKNETRRYLYSLVKEYDQDKSNFIKVEVKNECI